MHELLATRVFLILYEGKVSTESIHYHTFAICIIRFRMYYLQYKAVQFIFLENMENNDL